MASETVDRCLFVFMTTNTPAHLKRRTLFYNFHFFDSTVALLASKTSTALLFCLNVTLVWKSHKIGTVMDFHPFNRLILFVGFCDFLDVRAISPDNFVTTHTRVTGGNSSWKWATCTGVTVFTWNLALTRVNFVIKGNRLFRLVTHVIDGVARGPKPPCVCNRSLANHTKQRRQ